MFFKRFVSRVIWVISEFLARIFVSLSNKRIVINTLEDNFCTKRILIISPHSDDETIGCFGMVSQLNILPSYWLLCGGNSERVKEWKKSISEATPDGEANMLISSEPDGLLSKCSSKIYESLIFHLKAGKIDQVFCPSFYDAHPDHKEVALQVLKALAQGYISEAFFYQTNYPVPFDTNLYKFEMTNGVWKEKTKAYKNFNSQHNQVDFLILSRYQTYVSWLAGSKNCELFLKIDSFTAKQIIDSDILLDRPVDFNKTSILNTKNSLRNILSTLT